MKKKIKAKKRSFRAPRSSRNIRKNNEFRAFIKMLQDGTVAHWQDIADVLGVENDTITNWKKLPEAQEAIKKGIDRALSGMERAGGHDWRMWESKLKMLGIVPREKIDHTTQGKTIPAPIYGGKSTTTV